MIIFSRIFLVLISSAYTLGAASLLFVGLDGSLGLLNCAGVMV
jgi:hypothetical protein